MPRTQWPNSLVLCIASFDDLFVWASCLLALKLNNDQAAIGRGRDPRAKDPLLDGPAVVDDKKNNEGRRKAPAND
jgi:hypothetical protein